MDAPRIALVVLAAADRSADSAPPGARRAFASRPAAWPWTPFPRPPPPQPYCLSTHAADRGRQPLPPVPSFLHLQIFAPLSLSASVSARSLIEEPPRFISPCVACRPSASDG